MNKVPSLITLCVGAIRDAILGEENVNLHHVCDLPSELFNQIISNLPSLALQNLQVEMPFCRYENFETAWKTLYELRWKDVQHYESTTNWQQIYWEKHVQHCLDAAAESVTITSFDGFIGEVRLPDMLLHLICCEGQLRKSKRYSKLGYHCERFGIYVRSLRLQGKLCVAEIGNLLKNVQFRNLEVNGLQLKEQLLKLCKLLEQNRGTLESLEFVDCDLSAIYINTICNSLKMNVIKTFSITRSSLFYTGFGLKRFVSLPCYLESFLMSSRSLTTLILSNNNKNEMDHTTARLILESLLEAESGLQVLDLSGNNVCIFMSSFKFDSGNYIYPANKRLISLRVLNLRATDLQEVDIDNLSYSMVHMPYVKVLNLSDNYMLEDKGIEMLIPYLVEKSVSYIPLSELYLENCGMSHKGVKKLFTTLSSLRAPLKFLSIAENPLCPKNSEFGKYLGEFLCSGIKAIDVRGVGLGSYGFEGAESEIHGELSLVSIDISRNKGGVAIFNFLSKLISKAPMLISVKASNNRISMEAVPTLCSCLKAANGKLEHLDLQQNPLCDEPDIASIVAEFQVDGKPNILLSPPNNTR